jgi:C1A family cysteine protease
MGNKVLFSLLTLICLMGTLAVASVDCSAGGTNTIITAPNVSNIQKEGSSNFELAPLNPAFTTLLNNRALFGTKNSLGTFKAGYIPAPVDFSHLSKISGVKLSYSAKYDLRTMNKVTSVKDQGNAGNCWAFATYGSLESFLMPGEKLDFSENNMKNLLSSDSPDGFDFSVNDGGDYLMSTAYLARWTGPIKESDDPYNPNSVSSPQNLPVQKHVQNILFLPLRTGSLDNNNIKWAIQNYGAVATYVYMDQDPADLYYNPTTHSYYYNGNSIINHAVDIVGWDDNFNKNNFSIVPPRNGAFIVKNSWGTSGFGEKGYFYVSYYDSKIGTPDGVGDSLWIDNSNVVFTAEKTDNYKNSYQYDPLGWTQSLGYSNPTAYCVNSFTAKSNEVLKAVGFYTTDSNCNYQIYTSIDNAAPVLAKSGTNSTAGYHTIPLDTGIRLNAGQKFSVYLKLTTPNYNYPLAIEEPISGYSSKATSNVGESYISYDGQHWTDITSILPNTDVCIKAFTNPAGNLPTADFSVNKISGVSPLSVTFTSKTTGKPTSYYWDFGDGSTSNHASTATHTYTKAGVYTISLTVTNSAGSTTVTKQNYISVTAPVVKPVAKFTADNKTGNRPLTVTFTSTSTGNPTSYYWVFGDGSTSNQALTAIHKYTKSGVYTVSLTVTNKAGSNTAKMTKYITVR